MFVLKRSELVRLCLEMVLETGCWGSDWLYIPGMCERRAMDAKIFFQRWITWPTQGIPPVADTVLVISILTLFFGWSRLGF